MVAARTGALGIMTVKGDFIAFDGTDLERLAVGSDGLVIVADSTTVTGLRYALRQPEGYIVGARMSFNTISTINIAAGKARSSDDTFDISWGAPLTCDIAASGVNGLDTGVEAANAIYHEFVIADVADVAPVASLFSLSPTAPTLPAGYNKSRRMGAAMNGNGGANTDFFNFLQTGNGLDRRIEYDVTIGAGSMRVLTNGAAAAFTDVDLSLYVPSTSQNVRLATQFETGAGGAASDEGRLRPDGFSQSANNSGVQLMPGVVSAAKTSEQIDIGAPGQIVEYKVDDAANNEMTLNIIGYVDGL